MSGKVLKFGKVIGEAGGLVDETHVSLIIAGQDLDPTDISRRLGSDGTSSHRAGDPRRRSGTPYKQGLWLLGLQGRAPQSPDELTLQLLARLPDDQQTWNDLSKQYEVEIRFGVFMSGWNRGFDLSPAVVERIHRLRATIGFDLYFDAGEDKD